MRPNDQFEMKLFLVAFVICAVKLSLSASVDSSVCDSSSVKKENEKLNRNIQTKILELRMCHKENVDRIEQADQKDIEIENLKNELKNLQFEQCEFEDVIIIFYD